MGNFIFLLLVLGVCFLISFMVEYHEQETGQDILTGRFIKRKRPTPPKYYSEVRFYNTYFHGGKK